MSYSGDETTDPEIELIARWCLRPVRGCATDEQWQECCNRVAAAIKATDIREFMRERALQ